MIIRGVTVERGGRRYQCPVERARRGGVVLRCGKCRRGKVQATVGSACKVCRAVVDLVLVETAGGWTLPLA